MDGQTGARIRQQREKLGMRQAELARLAGVSASYLNLIEHGRRRIGGKLLLAIAGVLDLEPATLTEGEDPARLAHLRTVARDNAEIGAGEDCDPDILLRYAPDWADLVLAQQARIADLQRMVAVLNNRATHDPQLANALHEMLSTVTSIRSAASILAKPKDLSPEWQARFSRNVLEDARRLADASTGLVSYLGAAPDDSGAADKAPEDALARIQSEWGWHLPDIETAVENAQDVTPIVTRLVTMADISESGRVLLRNWVQQYSDDARVFPMTTLIGLVDDHGTDPFDLARRAECAPDIVMRRLASMPSDAVQGAAIGLLICDPSGALLFQKPLPEFGYSNANLAAGAPCPRWPLFRALVQPMAAFQVLAGLPGIADDLVCDAVALPQGLTILQSQPADIRAHMMVRRSGEMFDTGKRLDRDAIGVTCRICPRQDCTSRRVPSLVS